jgi:DNA-binding CsgD family transcriptional regulator
MPPMLIGRQEELHELTNRMHGDHPVAVLGEAGIGKSALLREALAQAGRPALLGGALASLQWMEYLPLARALGQRRLSGDPATVAARVRDGLRGDRVLVLEDLQWADPATLEVVSLLGAAPIVVSVRTADSAGDEVVPMLLEWGFATVSIDPLDAEAAEAVVRSTLTDASSVAVARLVRRCGGNPLLLTQLAAGGGEASESLRLALAARLRDATEAAARDFRLLATLGRPVPVNRLDAVVVQELTARRLVERSGEDVSVLHDLLGELALGGMPEADRRELHRRAAEISDDPGEMARHFEGAGDFARAHELATRAAGTAERAGERAAHLAVAARCAAGDADGLRLEAATALVGALRNVEAIEVLDAVHAVDPAMRAEVAILRSRAAWYVGDDDGFRRAVEVAVREGAQASAETHARAMVERARQSIFLDADKEPDGAIRRAEDALAMVRAANVAPARAEMIAGLAHYMADSPSWAGHFESALEHARSDDDLDTELLVANNLITAHESSGDPQRGEALADEMSSRAQAAGLRGWELQLRAMRLNLGMHDGAYQATIRGAIDLLDEPIDRRTRAQVEATLAIALIDVGSSEIAMSRLDELEARPGDSLMPPETARWLRSESALHDGRIRAALELARQAIELGMEDPFAAIVERWALADLGEAPAIPLRAPGMPMLRAVGPETEALAALSAGDDRTSVERFDEAASLWRTYHRRGELRCRWGAAEALRRLGDAPSARDRLLHLEEELIDRGMVPLLARVHRSLRAAGERRSAPRTCPDDERLTGREREVMRLVAIGLTNGEIARRLGVSRSTVVEHVARAMEALGATSRGQAAALLAS